MKIYQGLKELSFNSSNLPTPTDDDVGKVLQVNSDKTLSYTDKNSISEWEERIYKKTDIVLHDNFFYECIVDNSTENSFIESEWKRLHEINSDGMIKLNGNSDKEYLENLLNNSTISVVDNKLTAISLSGLTVTIADLNKVKDLGIDLETLKQSLSNSMKFIDVVSSLDELTGTYENGNTIIVSNDKSTMTYIYNGTEWKAIGEFKLNIRDFGINPLDLASEVTGLLPVTNIDMTNLLLKLNDSFYTKEQIDYKMNNITDNINVNEIASNVENNIKEIFMKKEVYDKNKDGIVDKAKEAENLSAAIHSEPGTVYMHSGLTNEVGFFPFVNLGDIVPDDPIYTSLIKDVDYLIELNGKETTTAVEVLEKNSSENNVDGVLIRYNNQLNVYGNKDNLLLDENGCKIKNEYIISTSLNSDNISEIDLSSFLDINGIEVIK